MAELRVQIPDAIIERLKEKLGPDAKTTDIAKDALTLFNWAVNERAKGRLVLSSDDKGEELIRLTMPSLESVKPTKV